MKIARLEANRKSQYYYFWPAYSSFTDNTFIYADYAGLGSFPKSFTLWYKFALLLNNFISISEVKKNLPLWVSQHSNNIFLFMSPISILAYIFPDAMEVSKDMLMISLSGSAR